MKKRICALLIVLVAIVLLREGSAAQQGDLHVVATFGIQGAMEKILPEYKRASGQNVSVEYEESAVIRQQVASGKVFDLAILVPQVIDDLIKSGQIRAGTRTDIAKTSLGIGIRSGASRREIGTAEGLKETLLSARSIIFSKVGSATPTIEKMIERLGIAGVSNPRIVRADTGRPADAVGTGQIDLVIAPASAIVSVPGVDFLGLLPAEFQNSVVLTAGIGTKSEGPDRARALVEFIGGGKGAAILRVSGMEPFVTSGATCDGLKSLSLPHTTITLAQSVAAGEFSPPARDERATSPQNTVFKELPAFCRVAATLKPSADSNIKMELWLPLEKWNGKFQAVGNGGWAGTISYMGRNAAANGGPGGMAGALQSGYATASTDTGHDDAGAKFALGHPEKLIDYAYRAVHEMTATSKAILTAFYGEPPKLSYFNGCSTGGRQALVEAQRYPEDFDGILAGAAANPKTHLDAWRVWMAQAMFKDQDSYIPPSKYPLIHEAVVGKCDALDGVKDGLIENPMQCHFDPKVLECKAADGGQCLTKAQVAAARIIMAPAKDRNTGTLIFPGFEPGNELGWGQLLKGPGPYDTALDDFKYVIFGDANWDWRTFDLQRDTAIADKLVKGTIEAVDPNLTKFAQRGGKLLMYHGWADQDIAPQASVNYYKNASNATKATSDWLRLFMMPGMQHCQGGEGPNSFDPMAAIEQWVEKGKAPDQIIASHRLRDGTVDRTRPLCPYPEVAKYKGNGSIDEAANFVCSAP